MPAKTRENIFFAHFPFAINIINGFMLEIALKIASDFYETDTVTDMKMKIPFFFKNSLRIFLMITGRQLEVRFNE